MRRRGPLAALATEARTRAGAAYQYNFNAACICLGAFNWPDTTPNDVLFRLELGALNTVRLNRLNASARKSIRNRSVATNVLPRLTFSLKFGKARTLGL